MLLLSASPSALIGFFYIWMLLAVVQRCNHYSHSVAPLIGNRCQPIWKSRQTASPEWAAGPSFDPWAGLALLRRSLALFTDKTAFFSGWVSIGVCCKAHVSIPRKFLRKSLDTLRHHFGHRVCWVMHIMVCVWALSSAQGTDKRVGLVTTQG